MNLNVERGDALTVLTMICLQFMGDLMTESVSVLERLANEEAPPLRRVELEEIREELGNPDADKEELLKRLSVMKDPWQKRGDIRLWQESALNKLDECFEENYMCGEAVSPWFYRPNSEANLEHSETYYAGVDRILTAHSDAVPPYARDWFVYYSIWEVHGYAFPMPLGTSKVIEAVEKLAVSYHAGIVEVS